MAMRWACWVACAGEQTLPCVSLESGTHEAHTACALSQHGMHWLLTERCGKGPVKTASRCATADTLWMAPVWLMIFRVTIWLCVLWR